MPRPVIGPTPVEPVPSPAGISESSTSNGSSTLPDRAARPGAHRTDAIASTVNPPCGLLAYPWRAFATHARVRFLADSHVRRLLLETAGAGSNPASGTRRPPGSQPERTARPRPPGRRSEKSPPHLPIARPLPAARRSPRRRAHPPEAGRPAERAESDPWPSTAPGGARPHERQSPRRAGDSPPRRTPGTPAPATGGSRFSLPGEHTLAVPAAPPPSKCT